MFQRYRALYICDTGDQVSAFPPVPLYSHFFRYMRCRMTSAYSPDQLEIFR